VGDAGRDSLCITVPSWRPDVTREVEVIEEIARLRGFDSFPDELRPFRPGNVPDSNVTVVSRRVRELLISFGLLEARPMPFVRGASEGYVRVANPLAENEAYLRRELLDSLARRAEHNLAHMQRDVRLFEVGSVFTPGEGEFPMEELRAAVLIMGHRRPAHFTEPNPPDFDEWDAKGIAESLARTAYPHRRAQLLAAGGATLWEIAVDGEARGEVRRLALDAPVWAAPAFGVELLLMPVDSGMVAPAGSASYETDVVSPVAGEDAAAGVGALIVRALPTTPVTFFDLALLVPNDMPVARVEDTLRSAAGDLLEQLTLLSEYRGDTVPSGFRSVAWRLTFRHPERTLRDKEIEGRRERVLRTLEGELGVRQRTA
jgi:phenylalanyl-tRNA synthetase beta chain